MRVLFTTFAGTDHLHPLVPLARALAAAGHTIAFAAAPTFCPAVEAVGFPCFPAGLDEPEAGWASLVPALRDVPQVGDAWTVLFMRHVFGDLLPQQMVPDLLSGLTKVLDEVPVLMVGVPTRESVVRNDADWSMTFVRPPRAGCRGVVRGAMVSG
jgi:hypothetical protein